MVLWVPVCVCLVCDFSRVICVVSSWCMSGDVCTFLCIIVVRMECVFGVQSGALSSIFVIAPCVVCSHLMRKHMVISYIIRVIHQPPVGTGTLAAYVHVRIYVYTHTMQTYLRCIVLPTQVIYRPPIDAYVHVHVYTHI